MRAIILAYLSVTILYFFDITAILITQYKLSIIILTVIYLLSMLEITFIFKVTNKLLS